MGSGKTTWGRKLANHLNKKFIDLDHVLVDKIGMSIPEYFQQFGEYKFRELESQTLMEIQDDNSVISTGGVVRAISTTSSGSRNEVLFFIFTLLPELFSPDCKNRMSRKGPP